MGNEQANLQVCLPICYDVIMPKSPTHERDIAEFTQTIGVLIRRVRAAAAEYGLSFTEVSVLRRLHKEGSATTAALARAESVKPQSMGSTIADLEEQLLVTRVAHPTDGRQQVISITDKGVRVRESMLSAKHMWLGSELLQLTEEEQHTVFEAGRILKRMLQI